MKLSKQVPLNGLRVFEAAARHLSFTKAGEELGLTQTAVSYQIKLLEETIGEPLFERRPRQVALTAVGEKLAPKVAEAFGLLGDALSSVQTMAGDTLKRSVEAARPGTTIITIPSSAIPEALKTQAVAKGVKLDFLMVTSNGQDMQTLAGLLEQGILQSHVSQTFDFAAMTKAHEAVETGRTRGKVVVTL